MFTPFQQVGDTARRAQGTGLGLAICRNLAELMGGTLTVASTLDVGNAFRFEVTLPEIAFDESSRPENRDVFVRFLTCWGCRTLEAENGQKALQIALQEHPNALITDLRMPEMDGGTLIQCVRQPPELQKMVIICQRLYGRSTVSP